MNQINSPLEVISYRGLFKSVEDSRKNSLNRGDQQSNLSISKGLSIVKEFVLFNVFFAIGVVENFLYFLMSGYDSYVYTPLQKILSPIVSVVPRYMSLGNGLKIPVFTANIVTLSRTFLVIPIAWYLKYDLTFMAFMCVVFHDFLDHLDGIVAKVQKVTYPNQDDPLLGGFLDAFCDKIVNVFSLWTIIQTIQMQGSWSELHSYTFLAICYGVIAYETVLGIVRVEDFFQAKFKREYNLGDDEKSPVDAASIIAASMEGKLKEKLESTGIALLCLSISMQNSDPILNTYGIAGLICLALTLRMAHKSLAQKLEKRKIANASQQVKCSAAVSNDAQVKSKLKKNSSALNLFQLSESSETEAEKESEVAFEPAEMKMVHFADNEIKEDHANLNYKYKKRRHSLKPLLAQTGETKPKAADNRVDKVYTVGCFDLFHNGHVRLIARMRELGKKVYVGVHDSRSIYKLKNRVPVDSTEKRMLNVKKYADEVFCVAGTDPSNFMSCILNLDKNETALFVRGNDMPDFPCRQVVEHLMPIKLLPYTEGISSTQLRKEKFGHIAYNDENYLETNN